MSNYRFLEPYQFDNGVVVKNRIVIPPMTETMSLQDGTVSKDELEYFERHTGGVGMFISPVAYVLKNGKGFEGQLAVDEDNYIDGLSKMASAMRKNGTKAILQIFHAGRMTNSKILRGKQPVSASAVASAHHGSEVPRELSSDEIVKIIKAFGDATRRAILAGFDGVEIHGANTYLIQQFFSPHSNCRTDKWGGSLEKRMNFPLAVIQSVKDAVNKYANKQFIIGYRISPEEKVEQPGIRIDDTLKLVDKLADQPIDYLHISMGDAWRKSLNNPSEQRPTVLRIKEVVNGRVPLISVGSLRTPDDVEKIMNAGIEFAALGREILREPAWVQKVKMGLESTLRYKFNKASLNELAINNTFRKYLIEMGINFNEDDPDRPAVDADDPYAAGMNK